MDIIFLLNLRPHEVGGFLHLLIKSGRKIMPTMESKALWKHAGRMLPLPFISLIRPSGISNRWINSNTTWAIEVDKLVSRPEKVWSEATHNNSCKVPDNRRSFFSQLKRPLHQWFTHKSQLDVLECLMAVTCFVASTHLCKYQVGCKLLPCEGGAGINCTADDVSGICQLMVL